MHCALTTTVDTTHSTTMKSNITCAIVSGGSYSAIDSTPYSYIIACDHGYDHCVNSGIVPDMVVGDMDSKSNIISDDVHAVIYDTDKDDTDTMIAVKLALELGYNNIHILCACGGRIDHMLGNIQCMVYAVNAGARCSIIDDNNIISATNSTLTVDKNDNFSLSLLSYTNQCTLSVSGTQYTLDNATIDNMTPLGISNVIVDCANITVKSGMLLVIQSRL